MMTIGTRLYTLFKGKLVGNDQFGNRYYEEKSAPKDRKTKRWVLYNGLAEASKVPPQWHAWLHYTTNELPLDSNRPHRKWEKEHKPNLTGTVLAYHPPGSVLEGGKRAKATGDYQAWKPE